MKRLAFLVTPLLLLAACGNGDGDKDDSNQDPSEDSSSEAAPVYEILPVSAEAPAGFVEAEGAEPDFPYYEESATQRFEVAGGKGEDRLEISSFVLPEGTDTSTIALQRELATSLTDGGNGFTYTSAADGALVNGKHGIYRFGRSGDGDDQLKQREYFIFSETQMVYASCQWKDNYEQVERACPELLAGIEFGGEWNDPLQA
ncbi:hypothetical protein [Salininema proteolyticum]|uniref:Lipoprotein n=1 Tax=Salininema proteolyticum TaxID=1607685 RepID=A0ABV8TX29_9ACTN